MKCGVCKEPTKMENGRLTHEHGDEYCGTGDGATAMLEEKKNRVAYHADESFAEQTRHGVVYWVVKITENEAGYERVSPWTSPDKAKTIAKDLNQFNSPGLTDDDVLEIRLSSFQASRSVL